jgi:NIMA (never in mitosis gene a)-related kinase
MSPEVCENKPYSSKSDMWALGCVLYELCTLQHAFRADNLLGLVFKIVQEAHPPIPEGYSAALRQLVDRLLSKNPVQR